MMIHKCVYHSVSWLIKIYFPILHEVETPSQSFFFLLKNYVYPVFFINIMKGKYMTITLHCRRLA